MNKKRKQLVDNLGGFLYMNLYSTTIRHFPLGGCRHSLYTDLYNSFILQLRDDLRWNIK